VGFPSEGKHNGKKEKTSPPKYKEKGPRRGVSRLAVLEERELLRVGEENVCLKVRVPRKKVTQPVV